MALFNIKKLSETIQGAAQEAVNTVASATKDIKVPDIQIPDIKLPIPTEPDASRGGETAQGGRASAPGYLSVSDSLRIIYYLMAADGQLDQDELDQFAEFGTQLGPNTQVDSAEIIADCEKDLLQHASSISPLVSAMTCVDGVLYNPYQPTADEDFVVPKQLIWNMLAICFADGSFEASERELINHVAAHFGVDEVVVSEMEGSINALTDLERESDWVKRTGDSYLTIDPYVKEIESRKACILEGVQCLIEL